MKTIKEHLAGSDREKLLNCLSYRFLDDPVNLLELKNRTVQDIRERYSRFMNGFIERLLSIDALHSGTRVFYLYTSYDKDEVLDLIDLAETAKDIEAPGHDFSFTDWDESLGFLVADTKLTQDNLIDLLAQYLDGASYFGADERSRAAKLSELEKKLDEGIRSMKEGRCRPAEEVFDEIRWEHGFPIPEKDPRQDALRYQAIKAVGKFERYSRTRERRRILSIGEEHDDAAPTAVESGTDAEWYCRKDPEEDRFFTIFFELCRKYNIRWTGASDKEKAFIEELTRVTYERDRAIRNGEPLSEIRPAFE